MNVSTDSDAFIREAGPADAFAIAAVNVRTWQESYRDLVPQEFLDRMSPAERAESFARRHDEEFYWALVAEPRGGGVVGYVDYGAAHDSDLPFAGELYSIYVLPEHQRGRIGERLFRAAAESLVARGLDSMSLSTLEVSPYRSFYEKMGGRLVRRGTHDIGGVAFVELVYGWDDLKTNLPG